MLPPKEQRFVQAIFWTWISANFIDCVMKEKLVDQKTYDHMTKILKVNWYRFSHPFKQRILHIDIEAGFLDWDYREYPENIRDGAMVKFQRKCQREARAIKDMNEQLEAAAKC